MNVRPIEAAQDPDLRLSEGALRRAAQRAQQVAQQTGTAIVISRQGIVELVPPAVPAAPSSTVLAPAAPGKGQ